MPTKEEMQSLAQDIARSYEERIPKIAQLRATVKTQLKELDDTHKAMSTQLRADLAKGEGERLRETRALKQELVSGLAERKSAVAAELKELDSAHAAMGRALRAELGKVRPPLAEEEKRRQKEAREFRSELGKAVAEGKAVTQARLKELAGIEAGARGEWQKLAASMQVKRGVPVVEVKPPMTAAPPPVEAVAPPVPVEEIAEDEAVARAEVDEVPPEMAELRDRVFAYLANHPDGIRMTELEQEFGLARIQMARILRNLMDENMVEKRDLLYFAK